MKRTLATLLAILVAMVGLVTTSAPTAQAITAHFCATTDGGGGKLVAESRFTASGKMLASSRACLYRDKDNHGYSYNIFTLGGAPIYAKEDAWNAKGKHVIVGVWHKLSNGDKAAGTGSASAGYGTLTYKVQAKIIYKGKTYLSSVGVITVKG